MTVMMALMNEDCEQVSMKRCDRYEKYLCSCLISNHGQIVVGWPEKDRENCEKWIIEQALWNSVKMDDPSPNDDTVL